MSWRRWQLWAVLGIIFVLGHFVSRGLGRAGLDDNTGFWWGGDLAGCLVPPLGNRWLATAASDVLWRSPRFYTTGSVENVMFLGHLLPLLALVLAVVAWRARHAGLRLPASAVHYVLFLNNIRCPTRHVLLLSLLLPLATCIGLDGWLRRGPTGRGWALAAVFFKFQPDAYPLIRLADVRRPTAWPRPSRGPWYSRSRWACSTATTR